MSLQILVTLVQKQIDQYVQSLPYEMEGSNWPNLLQNKVWAQDTDPHRAIPSKAESDIRSFFTGGLLMEKSVTIIVWAYSFGIFEDIYINGLPLNKSTLINNFDSKKCFIFKRYLKNSDLFLSVNLSLLKLNKYHET